MDGIFLFIPITTGSANGCQWTISMVFVGLDPEFL